MIFIFKLKQLLTIFIFFSKTVCRSNFTLGSQIKILIKYINEYKFSGTDLSAINADTVKGSKIGNVIMKNMIGVAPGQSCVDGKFFEELHNNLKKNNKFVIL
jgi:hypothetical protein